MSDTTELFAEGLFKGLAADEAKAFLRRCQEKSYPDGTNLFKEQNDAATLYLILSGGIELRYEMPQRENAETAITSLKPGDTVGWSAVVVIFGLAVLTFFGVPFISIAPHKGVM